LHRKSGVMAIFNSLLCLTIALAALLPAAMAAPAGAWTTYPLQTSDTEIVNALNYLRGAQGADGNMGGFGSSAWVVMAIAAAGEDPDSWNAGGPSVVDYLAANASEAAAANDYSRMILAIVAADEDPANFGGRDFVALLQAEYNGGQIGNPSFLNDDFWGVMALVSAGITPGNATVADSVAFIKSNQGVDGGWSWGVGQDSDVDDTAAAIMALLAAGEAQGSTAVQDGLAYIKSQQMDNGGFQSWGATNSGTDSWGIDAIVAAGQSPTGAAWLSGSGNSSVDDLLTFQTAGGSFDWQIGTPLSPEKMTADAVIALLGEFYPVSVMQPEAGETVYVRVEGPDATVWRGEVTVTDSTIMDDLGGPHYLADATAMGALDEASQDGGFPYTVRDFGWGIAVTSVNAIGDWDAGPWWLYRVDYMSASVGADAFILNQTSPPAPPHYEVLFYTSSTWSEQPLQIELDKAAVAVNETFTVTVTYYNDSATSWDILAGATVHAGSDYVTGANGTAAISVDHNATIDVYAEMAGFVRSDKEEVIVGSGGGGNSSGEVSLEADIIPAIAININPSEVDFGGDLGPRDISPAHSVVISNAGAWDIVVTAEVTDTADGLFFAGLYLDGGLWSSFSQTILRAGNWTASVTLHVPEDYSGVGAQAGTMTFWATEAP
jgi:hypothetical protein